jgi:hypothetical protein
MLNTDPHGLLHRLVAVLAGLAIVGFGLGPLVQRGDLFSRNWFGGLVFALTQRLLNIDHDLDRLSSKNDRTLAG